MKHYPANSRQIMLSVISVLISQCSSPAFVTLLNKRLPSRASHHNPTKKWKQAAHHNNYYHDNDDDRLNLNILYSIHLQWHGGERKKDDPVAKGPLSAANKHCGSKLNSIATSTSPEVDDSSWQRFWSYRKLKSRFGFKTDEPKTNASKRPRSINSTGGCTTNVKNIVNICYI